MEAIKKNERTDFDKFLENYQNGKMSVLVGAGLSMNVSKDFRSWRTLMKEIVEYIYKDQIDLHCENYLHIYNMQEYCIDDIKEKYINSILDKEDFIQLASTYIKKKGYREAIDHYIECKTPRLILCQDGNIELCTKEGSIGKITESDLAIHKALLKCQNFQNIYTTNYDNVLEVTSKLLEKNESLDPHNIVTSGCQLSGKLSHNIIKIHGSIDDSKDFQFDGDKHLRYIIAQEDYDTYLNKHEAFSYLMRIAMLQGVFCLVGFSGTDPNYLAWVKWMSDILDVGSDDKIYLLDIDGKKVPDDLQSFYSNHHIVVINLWDQDVLTRIFYNSHPDKFAININKNRNNSPIMTEDEFISNLQNTKLQFNEVCNKKQDDRKKQLELIIIEYKKIILEYFFLYLQKSKKNIEFINQDTVNDISNNSVQKNVGKTISITQPHALSDTKAKYYDYRKLWEELYKLIKENSDLQDIIDKIFKIKSSCRFSKVIFPQESLINHLMKKESLSAEKAYLFALAVSDIGQLPSYYDKYMKDDVELNKQPLWIKLKEREATLRTPQETFTEISEDWSIYEQIQRYLFNLEFSQAKELVNKWQAKGYWIQAKAMRMAVYQDQRNAAFSLLDSAIKTEKNPTEKLYDIILANFIARQWPMPYSTEEFWKYGLDGQGDLLGYMMSTLREKEEKPQRRGWIGRTTRFGSNHGDYTKSLRILQFIIDSGIYPSIPGSYIFDIASWYKVFSNLYEHFPYPCFFYSILYNDRNVQRRIGEDFAYNIELQDFVQDILKKSLSVICDISTPSSFEMGILNITAAMYVAINEDEWYEQFRKTVFKKLLENLSDIDDSHDLVFNVKFALGSLKKQANISDAFQELMNNYTINNGIVSDIIVYNLRVNSISSENALKNISIFSNILEKNTLNLLEVLNGSKLLSDKCKEEIIETVIKIPEENIPHDRIALIQLVHLTQKDTTAIEKIKKLILSMDIWHCGALSNGEVGWTEPNYIMLHLLEKDIIWSDAEFEIIKENLIKNVTSYDNIHEKLHQDSFMKSIQIRYLSNMLNYIDKLEESRYNQLSETYKTIERLLKDRVQYANNTELMMSEQPADVDYAFNNIYEHVANSGLDSNLADIDFIIHRAMMKTPIALTVNLKYIYKFVDRYGQDLFCMGYAKKIKKLLSVFKNSETWELLDLRFAFNYLYRIAKKMSEYDKSDKTLDFWLNDAFVKKFVIEF